MNDVVKMGKCGCVSPAIWLVQGDTRSHILTIRVPRMESGVDLKDLAWKINITNEAGVDDVDVPVMGSVVIDERTIAFDWLIHGVATDVPGKTTFSVVGVDETEDGKPIIWRSSPAMIYIREKHDATPSEEVEAELGELEKMIVYVNGELTNVIAAGEMARSAATHPPIIGDNGNWFLWDLEKEIYVDSGMNTRGPKGDAGYTPVKDKDYFDGKDGYTPQKGKDYFDGAPGEPGKSAYEIARENGFEGSEKEWLDYLRADSDKLMLIQLYEVEQNGSKYLRHDFTVQEIKDAVAGNKIVLMRDPMGKVYYYSAEKTIAGSYLYFYTTGEYVAGLGIMYDVIVVYSDGAAVRLYIDGKKGDPMRTPNPRSLKIKYGKREISYDGYVDRNIEIADNVLVVKLGYDENYNFVVDKTQAEVKQAVADGKAVIMLDADVGTTFLYMGESTMDGEQCPFFVSPLSEIGMTALFANIVYLKKSGEVVYMSGSPINQLTIKTADGTETFDGSVPKTIDLSNLGSGGTFETPTEEEILQALIDTDFLLAVTDSDGAILTDADGAILVM